MKSIRRLYFYLVVFISIEVVVWGLIGLLRSIVDDTVSGGADALAQQRVWERGRDGRYEVAFAAIAPGTSLGFFCSAYQVPNTAIISLQNLTISPLLPDGKNFDMRFVIDGAEVWTETWDGGSMAAFSTFRRSIGMPSRSATPRISAGDWVTARSAASRGSPRGSDCGLLIAAPRRPRPPVFFPLRPEPRCRPPAGKPCRPPAAGPPW